MNPINCTALFAISLSWSDAGWNVACARVDLCKVEFILLEFFLFWRREASTGLGEPEIISGRGSGIYFSWIGRTPLGILCSLAISSRIVVMSMGSVIAPFFGWNPRPRHIFCGMAQSLLPKSFKWQFILWERSDIILANVPRQVSLAGAAGGSQETGAKALGLLCSSQALCLSASSR